MSRQPFLKRPVAALLFVLQLAGCTSWHVETLPAAELISEKHPDRLRVEGVDGKRLMFYGPNVQGDSLQGRPSAGSKGSRTVALAGVRSVSTAQTDVLKTLGLTLGVAATTVGVVALIAVVQLSGDWSQ
jgi:hypothetical protein